MSKKHSSKPAKASALTIEIPDTILQIPVDTCWPSPANNRETRDSDIKSLADSIQVQGLLQFPTVRPHPTKKGHYEIVCGERRWRAIKLLSKNMPAVVRELSDAAAHEITVIENMQREDLTPMEEAAGVNTLLQDGQTYEQIADHLGKTRQWVARRAKLTNLSPKWIEEMQNPKSNLRNLSVSHLELIARFDHHIQDQILEGNIGMYDLEYATLDELRESCSLIMRRLPQAPWPLADESLVPDAGACSKCQKRSSMQPDLFDQVENKGKAVDQCIDKDCWEKKQRAYVLRRHDQIKAKNPEVIAVSTEYRGTPTGEPLIDNAVRSYHAETAKKTDVGAIPALIVDGPNAGQLKWIRKPDQASGSGQRLKGQPVPLEQRRQALEKRRRKAILDSVIAVMKSEIDEPKLLLEIPVDTRLCAALAFGCETVFEAIDGRYNSDHREDWEGYRHVVDFMRKDQRELPDLSLDLICCVLPHLIRNIRQTIQSNAGMETEFAQECCSFIGIDFAGIKDEIEKKIKEPKAWAKLTGGSTESDAPDSPEDTRDFEDEEPGSDESTEE